MTQFGIPIRRGFACGLLLLLGCGDDATCTWEVDELLAQVDVVDPERKDCGTSGSTEFDALAALDCLRSDPEHGAQVAVNMCIDCYIVSTYVVSPEGEMFLIEREDDAFGDHREVTVSSCSDLTATQAGTIECASPSEVYACRENRE